MKGFKFFLALLLLPLVAAQMWTLVDLLAAWFPAGHWRTLPTLCVGAGFTAWLIIFYTLPHPLWFYVLSHELTHALAVYLSGGKVYAIQVASTGGHVASDRVNWWISLSPYFIPLYTLILMGLWYSVDFYYPLDAWLTLLCFAFGFTFSFHVTYTVSMLHKDQKDLISQGFFFSAVVILAMNLLLVTLFFIPVARNVNWMFAAQQLATRAVQCYSAPVIALIKSQERTMIAQKPLPWTPPQAAVGDGASGNSGASGSTGSTRRTSTAGMLRLSPEEREQGPVARQIRRQEKVKRSETTLSKSKTPAFKTSSSPSPQPPRTATARKASPPAPKEYDVTNAPRAIAIKDSAPASRKSSGSVHMRVNSSATAASSSGVSSRPADPAVRVRSESAPARKPAVMPGVPAVGVIGSPQGA